MTDLNPQSPPEQWSELLAGYVLGDLTPAEISLVEQHLAAHPDRQSDVASLQLSLNLLPLALPADLPIASLRQQIIQIAEGETVTQNAAVQQPEFQPQLQHRWKQIVAGLGLLSGLGILSCLGLGWNNYRLSQELATVKQELHATRIAQNSQKYQTYQSVISLLQQPNNRLLALKNREGKSMGMGSLVMAPQKSSALLTLQQMAPLAKGQVYRMWAIMGDEEMACADFLPDPDGKVSIEIPLNRWEKAKKVMITIEQKGAKEAEGEVAIEGEVGV
jgi:Anti-sigma-K factor rskA/Putative zinc-finger